MEPHMQLMRVVQIEVIHDYVVRFTFSDGTVRDIDLERFLHGGIFEQVRDPAFFRRARVAYGTIAWPNEADLDPNVLYYNLKTAREEAAEQDVVS